MRIAAIYTGTASLCLLLLLALSTRKVEAAPQSFPPDAYTHLYARILAANSPDKVVPTYQAAGLSEIAARLWIVQKDPANRELSLRYLDALLQNPQFNLKDFHALQGFGRLVLLLQKNGMLTPSLTPRIRQIAQDQLVEFLKSQDDGDYNIRLAQVLGYASLLRFLDDTPYADRERVQRRLDDYWQLIRQTGDLDEDASNYDSLGAVFMVDLAQTLDHERDLKTIPGFRRLFERFRDIVSPSGLMPGYGDAYFSYTGVPLDRVLLMEYAASLYGDASYLSAARLLWNRAAYAPSKTLPGPDDWFRATPLITFNLLSDKPVPPAGPPSQVMMRARRGTVGSLVDKLILRTGREPGESMVMLDLYASGSHAHQEKGPSIAYYESAEVPLFHNMGRHRTRSAIDGNLCWAMPAGEPFPGCWNRDREWHTMRIPTSYLRGDGATRTLAQAFSLRNFAEQNRECRDVWFDNLRLDGPGGTLMVDDFEDTSAWDPRLLRITHITASPDRTQGQCSQQVEWKPLPSAEFQRKLPHRPTGAISLDRYPFLDLDLKYAGERPYAHIRGLGRQVDLGDQLLPAHVASAKAHQRSRDAYGQVDYDSYVTPDTTLRRQIVLTAEGCLVIHDILRPGSAMAGWRAGQLWQMYEMAQAHGNWFCSADDGAYPTASGGASHRRMAVRFDPGSSGSVGSSEINQPYFDPNPAGRKPTRFYTTFSERVVQSGRPESFTMVVIPFDGDDATGARAADQVRFAPGPGDQVQVTLSTSGSGHAVVVEIGPAGWQVRREP